MLEVIILGYSHNNTKKIVIMENNPLCIDSYGNISGPRIEYKCSPAQGGVHEEIEVYREGVQSRFYESDSALPKLKEELKAWMRNNNIRAVKNPEIEAAFHSAISQRCAAVDRDESIQYSGRLGDLLDEAGACLDGIDNHLQKIGRKEASDRIKWGT